MAAGLLTALLLGACVQTAAPDVDPAPAAPSAAAPEAALPAVVISEIMPSNKSTLALPDGSFPDWIELYNTGSEPAALEGMVLQCGNKRSRLLPQTLAPGETVLLPCDEAARLTLPREGATLNLYTAEGVLVDRMRYGAVTADVSLCRGADGTPVPCIWPSPGRANDFDGYVQCQQERAGAELVINEAMCYNEWYLLPGGYCDWVELKNTGDAPLDLSGYALSDDRDRAMRAPLPAVTLAPGEIVTFCLDVPGGLPFGLAADREQLFLSRADGSLCDYVSLHDIPLGASVGRMADAGGFFYFAAPSPGAENTGGLRGVADKPAAAEPCGIFESADSVTVTLSGLGEIHYTLDGSLPTAASPLYTGPLTLTQTGVVRAVCLEADKLPGKSLDLSYILNEGHQLPVISVIADPEDVFSLSGIYSNPTANVEVPAHAALYTGEGEEFSLACGIKMHGATSRTVTLKKTWKLCFRPRYDGLLHDDVFSNGVTDYADLLVRAACESSVSTNIRDILMHELAQQCYPGLPTQDYRFCVLYINGEYWGLYALREAHSTEHYAFHYGYDPDSVAMWQGKLTQDPQARAVYDFITSNDMRDPDNYAAVARQLDLESVIAWCIIESYSGNIDMNSPNMRFYRSDEDNVVRYALVDLDLGMFDFGPANLGMRMSYAYSTVIMRLMENPDFRALYLQRMAEYLKGPLSDENFIALTDRLIAEQESEIPRDAARWRYRVVEWRNEVDTYLYGSVKYRGGHALTFADSAKQAFHMSEEEWYDCFGFLLPKGEENP